MIILVSRYLPDEIILFCSRLIVDRRVSVFMDHNNDSHCRGVWNFETHHPVPHHLWVGPNDGNTFGIAPWNDSHRKISHKDSFNSVFSNVWKVPLSWELPRYNWAANTLDNIYYGYVIAVRLHVYEWAKILSRFSEIDRYFDCEELKNIYINFGAERVILFLEKIFFFIFDEGLSARMGKWPVWLWRLLWILAELTKNN